MHAQYRIYLHNPTQIHCVHSSSFLAQTVLEVSIVDVDNDEHSSMMILAKFGHAMVTSKRAMVLGLEAQAVPAPALMLEPM